MARCCPPEAAPVHATAAGAVVAAVRAHVDNAEATAGIPGQRRSDAAAACFAAGRMARRANRLLMQTRTTPERPDVAFSTFQKLVISKSCTKQSATMSLFASLARRGLARRGAPSMAVGRAFGARYMSAEKPSLAEAKEMPTTYSAMSNDIILAMSAAGDLLARQERLTRHVMAVDGVDWDDADVVVKNIADRKSVV